MRSGLSWLHPTTAWFIAKYLSGQEMCSKIYLRRTERLIYVLQVIDEVSIIIGTSYYSCMILQICSSTKLGSEEKFTFLSVQSKRFCFVESFLCITIYKLYRWALVLVRTLFSFLRLSFSAKGSITARQYVFLPSKYCTYLQLYETLPRGRLELH